MKIKLFNININITPIVTSLFLILFTYILSSCGTEGGSDKFNVENSDPKAVEIADQVMAAMGGKENWENTRHLSWEIFDSRKHFWDKKTGDVRIESLNDDLIILMNINNLDGQVYKDGEILENPDSVAFYLEKGKNFWINDSYWFIMPYKLKDPGVTLKYIGEDKVDGKKADVVQLTFEEVGTTPENKYLVYVDQDSKLVTQWAYFKNADQEEPNFVTSWKNYKQYDNILLSSTRGDVEIKNISVHNSLPKEVYNSFEPTSL